MSMKRLFQRKPHSAIVLGCGPAGMFATHALAEAGWRVTVLSKKRRSQMFGCQYLHQPIKGLSGSDDADVQVSYELRGTAAGYARKVYGTDVTAKQTSAAYLIGKHPAWDIRKAYSNAYFIYQDLIADVGAGGIDIQSLCELVSMTEPALVVSSIPHNYLCTERCAFVSQDAWAIGDAPELGITAPISCLPETVICDGTDERSWYRVSNVFGHTTVEWPVACKPPFPGVAKFSKPLRHACTCAINMAIRWPHTKLLLVGRYGRWDKHELSHHAYERTISAIQSIG